MTTVASILADALKELGVSYVFGVPSGNWVDYMAAIQEVEGIEFILVSNESSAGFMADVHWRLTGRVAACFATFGPGACNLTTGVCGGYLDRAPMIALTDEMNDTMLHRTAQMNIDHQALFQPITRWTTRLDPLRVRETVYKAYQLAVSEVPGPVHIGLPAGIGLDEVSDGPLLVLQSKPIPHASPEALQTMKDLFIRSRKPVVALGITAVRAGVRELVLQLVASFKLPVVLTPMAKGMVPEDHPCYAGVLAHALGDMVGKIHQQADCVIGIGYDPVEINYEDWMPEVPLIHIDTSPADLDQKRFTLGCDVVGDLSQSLRYLLDIVCDQKEWDLDLIGQQRQAMFERLAPPEGVFGPRYVLEQLRKMLPRNGIMTCDVGAHLHLIGQQWKTDMPESQLMTNGCSSMGFAMPAAVAAKLSCPERPVCCVVGDGGFYMMLGELATARRLQTNIVFVVINDAYLSLIRIKQERKGFDRYGTLLEADNEARMQTKSLLSLPVFEARNREQYDHVLNEAFAVEGPAIVEVFVTTDDYDELVLKGNR